MSSLNLAKITVAGHLVREPELKMTPSGVPCTTVTVGVNRKSDNGTEMVSDFYTVIAFRGTAEMICRFFRKGSAIYVEGKFRMRAYIDKNGIARKAPEVIASEVNFIDSKSMVASENQYESSASERITPVPEFTEPLGGTDDDLPF